LNGSQFIFSWNTVAGQQFQVEFKGNLSDSTWIPLGGVLTGTGGTMSFTNAFDESPQGFLRLRVLP
jgi:hypothetical protein